MADFNADDSGKDVIVVQEASGKEGISLHDTTGKHQRVCVTLALPQSPITALQIEGRIYRIGNRSNAIFEYPLLGLDMEMILFGQTFNARVGTTENLALGSKARDLRSSFARGVEEHSGEIDPETQGLGGKEFDGGVDSDEYDGFDRAVLDYYGNQKLNGRRDNREGVDYFPTPEPLGYMMSQWGNIEEGDRVLEPSAGHGAIARYVPTSNVLTAVEPSNSLFAKLQMRCGGTARKYVNSIFENYDRVNKHEVVLMNPPFGRAGRLAVDHVAKAFSHLSEGGRIVAIIPMGSTTMKFEKWYGEQKDAHLVGEVLLPDITFQQAGTSVRCRVVVIDRITKPELAQRAVSNYTRVDLSGRMYERIEDFFEDIRYIDIPGRTIDFAMKLERKAASSIRELKAIKGVEAKINEHGELYVSGPGIWESLDLSRLTTQNIRAKMIEHFKTYDMRSHRYNGSENRGDLLRQEIMAEMKRLVAKLADMSVEEMERYAENEDSILMRSSDSADDFATRQQRAIAEHGIVMPGLNEAEVRVVEVPRHDFAGTGKEALNKAERWAKENIVGIHTATDSNGIDFEYSISNDAVEKYVSRSATGKSANIGVHLAALKKLPEIITESIEAEVHPSYKKGYAGLRGIENGYNSNALTHRFYGAVRIDGQLYRIKTTIIEENLAHPNTAHSYEVAKIEVLAEKANTSDGASPSHIERVRTAKLLQGVEKSYDPGKKLLDESADTGLRPARRLRTDMAKLDDTDRRDMAEYLEKLPCASLAVIGGEEDVDSHADLSSEAKAELRSITLQGDSLAAYCQENKKIYIFADGSRQAGGFTLQSTLVHENAHALADSIKEVDEAFLSRFADAVEHLPSNFFRNIRGRLLSAGYETSELLDEIFSVTLQLTFQKPKAIERLRNALTAADRSVFDKVLTNLYGKKDRYKEAIIHGFRHKADQAGENLGGAGLGRGAEEGSSAREAKAGREAVERRGDGYGAYSDAEVSYANDPASRLMGRNRFSKKSQAEFAARERQRMVDRVKELAEPRQRGDYNRRLAA